MRLLARLAVGLVKLAVLGALVAGGALAAYVAWEASQQDGTDTSASEQFDCNGPLPGCGFPWIHGVYAASPEGYSSWVGFGEPPPDFQGFPGEFDLMPFDGINFQDTWLPVTVGEDDRPLRWEDMYRMVFAVHPDLGGSGVRPASEAEREGHGVAQEWKGDHWYVGESGGGDLYYLTPIPNETLERLATSDSGCTSPTIAAPTTRDGAPAATASSTTTTVAKESRRYQVSVYGWENKIPNPAKTTPNGVRFDYILFGEFTIERTDASSPWKVTTSRIVDADVKYRSLYPADHQLTLSCEFRSCERLREATRLFVQVQGEEVIVSWGYFYPDVRIRGTCTDCPDPIDRYAKSDDFFARINSATLPLEKSYRGPDTISRYSNGEVQVSYRYSLGLLP
jgi:hypothetical protein